MAKEKVLRYKKSYVEVYEILKNLSIKQQTQIPEEVKENLLKNMDTNYIFKLDNSKTIFEQNLMAESEALLVEIYIKYLAPKSENELWKKYDNICLNKIEEIKREKYNPDDVFKNYTKNIEVISNNNYIEETSMIEYKKSIFYKIKMFFKNLFFKN